MDIDVPHLFGPRIVKTVDSKFIGACIVRDAPFISHDFHRVQESDSAWEVQTGCLASIDFLRTPLITSSSSSFVP